MAWIKKSSTRGKTHWRIVWRDAVTGRERSTSCGPRADHTMAFEAAKLKPEQWAVFARGARTKVLREALCEHYGALEDQRRRDALRSRGVDKGPRTDTPLRDLIDAWQNELDQEASLREQLGGRSGKSPRTVRGYKDSLARFTSFLATRGEARLSSGDLTTEHLSAYRRFLINEEGPRGRPRRPATVNRDLRVMRTFINRVLVLSDRRPFFNSTGESLKAALRRLPEERDMPERYEPAELQAFLEAALAHDSRSVQVARRKGSNGKLEIFEQGNRLSPLAPWVTILTFTGCRRGEAERLRWSDVDLERGALVFRAPKTGRARRVPLDDPRTLNAPMFLDWLRRRRADHPDATFVLPETGADGQPAFPKKPWAAVRKTTGLPIRPKGLRSNWVCYLVSLGVPIATVALMAGHSPQVLERHYLSWMFARLEGETLEDALGIPALDGHA